MSEFTGFSYPRRIERVWHGASCQPRRHGDARLSELAIEPNHGYDKLAAARVGMQTTQLHLVLADEPWIPDRVAWRLNRLPAEGPWRCEVV